MPTAYWPMILATHLVCILMHCNLIIATWNRAALLRQTLESLLTLQTPAGMNWDVTVADNHSTDTTAALVKSMQPHFEGRLQYLYEPTQGKSFALNRALAQTQGDWVLFLDDDVKASSGLLLAYQQGLSRHPWAVVMGGPIEPWFPEGQRYTNKQHWLLAHYPACFGIQAFDDDLQMNPPAQSAWGANMMVQRSALPATGFDTQRGMVAGRRIAGEDVAMVQYVLQTSGSEGWLIAGASVAHYTPADMVHWRRVWQWQRAIGSGWTASRGRPVPGKLGVPWWAYGEFSRRAIRLALHWRPSSTREFGEAFVAAAQWWGYLKGN